MSPTSYQAAPPRGDVERSCSGAVTTRQGRNRRSRSRRFSLFGMTSANRWPPVASPGCPHRRERLKRDLSVADHERIRRPEERFSVPVDVPDLSHDLLPPEAHPLEEPRRKVPLELGEDASVLSQSAVRRLVADQYRML